MLYTDPLQTDIESHCILSNNKMLLLAVLWSFIIKSSICWMFCSKSNLCKLYPLSYTTHLSDKFSVQRFDQLWFLTTDRHIDHRPVSESQRWGATPKHPAWSLLDSLPSERDREIHCPFLSNQEFSGHVMPKATCWSERKVWLTTLSSSKSIAGTVVMFWAQLRSVI